MKSYLVTLSPLEPYFFGEERSFGFGEIKGNLKQRYFISSLNTPCQTTLLGVLRYAVLAANNALITDFSKDSIDRVRADEMVGAESFNFSGANNFGVIGGIHSLFILHGNDYLVPMPMNHKNENDINTYTPIKIDLCPEDIKLSTGKYFSPDYDAKHHCKGGWLNLADNSVVPTIYDTEEKTGLFQSEVRIGINSHRTEKAGTINENDSFFKKEYKLLRNGEFAFFADIEPEFTHSLKSGITVFLGQNRSAFTLRVTEKENDLPDRISMSLSKSAVNDFWYASADCHFNQQYNGFIIAQSKLFRHLTSLADNRFYYRINKTERLYRLINAGAVFYGDKPEFADDKAPLVIGMNELVKITKGG